MSNKLSETRRNFGHQTVRNSGFWKSNILTISSFGFSRYYQKRKRLRRSLLISTATRTPMPSGQQNLTSLKRNSYRKIFVKSSVNFSLGVCW